MVGNQECNSDMADASEKDGRNLIFAFYAFNCRVCRISVVKLHVYNSSSISACGH